MDWLLNFLQSGMNIIINVLGLVVTALLLGNASKLSTFKSYILDALDRKNIRTMLNAQTLELEDSEERDRVTPDTIRNYERDFNKVCSKYNVYAQLIPIFPLLGILGTVAGLISEVKAGSLENIMSSLDLALWSTFFGLVWAIVLKIIAAVAPSRIINDVEIMLDDYDKKINNSVMLGNITAANDKSDKSQTPVESENQQDQSKE